MGAYLMNNYGKRTLSLVKGEGRYVWDSEGRRYLDALTGIAVCGLGHSHPAVSRAIAEQAATLSHVSNYFRIPQQESLAEKLCSVSGMEKVFFSNSGAEANEAAIKLTRLYAREKGIAQPTVIVMENCFHGRTLATLSATWGAKVRQGFEPLVEKFVHVPYNDIEAVARHSGDDSVVAVMVEPVQGEAGINIPADDYLQKLRTVCDQNGWLLVLDEIQTGNGRSGAYFSASLAGVQADIITTAKGLGNGVPIGACMAQGIAADLFGPGSHGSTYGGNPLVCAAANTVFDVIQEEQLAVRASQLGEKLKIGFESALANCETVKQVRNLGLLMAIEMNCDCTELYAQATEAGLLVNVTGGNRIRLLPALNMTDAEAGELLDRLCSLIHNWANSAD
ncbi:MAG: aspartate aminotransferase family protein [Porticoccaceae bacterium]